MPNDVFRGQFAAMVQRAGGVETVAAVLEARYGSASKGTISKMCAGQASLTLGAVIALEDHLGSFPITKRMTGRIGETPLSHVSLPEMAATCVVVAGQAHGALMRALSEFSEDGSELSARERADVLPLMLEARDMMDHIIRAAEKQAGAN